MIMCPNQPLPFIPLRWSLYNHRDLFAGFVENEPESYGKTADFAIYEHYVRGGSAAPDQFTGMMRALHDQSIYQALQPLLAGHRVAAVMGSHAMPRSSVGPYATAARLARRLTRAGLLVCTGGGPGAMEAVHLGAALANSPDEALDEAFAQLARAAESPNLKYIIRRDGAVDQALVKQAHAWFAPALGIAARLEKPGVSLGIPTWHYGHEPTTPFATHIAKFFQNSIREDGLLAVASQGIVFCPGRAGTIQEIFQDAAQNFYRSYGYFSPMVLLGTAYWRDTYPVIQLLQRLFSKDDFDKRVLLTDDPDHAAEFIESFVPPTAGAV